MKKIIAASFILLSVSGCAGFTGNDATVEPLIVNRVPNAIVGFTAGSAAFNNVAVVEKKLIGSGVVLVANANSSTFALAEQRLGQVASQLVHKKEVYVSYRYSDRKADQNLVEFFSFDSADEVPGILKEVNTYSLDSALGLQFSEKQTRSLEYQVKRSTIYVPKALTLEGQLASLVSQLGWELNGSVKFAGLSDGGSVAHEMDVVLVDGELATGNELRSVIAAWLNVYGATGGYSVALDDVSKKVVVYQ